MDLLELLAADEAAETTANMVDAIRPGTRLIFADYCDWPDATLTVVSVRPVTTPKGSPTHIIRTTSEHPGPPWSSYDREWWAWFVAKHMSIEEPTNG
jgi:hypothetical protein